MVHLATHMLHVVVDHRQRDADAEDGDELNVTAE
jgi:hypothetical protein